MAVRLGCPIYTYEFILESAGVILDDEDEAGDASTPVKKEVETKTNKPFAQYSVKELEKMLDEVLEEEDYEKAAKIRDEINTRSQDS